MQKPRKLKGRRDRGMIVVGVIAGIIAIVTVGTWVIVGVALNRGPGVAGDSAPTWSADSAKVAFASDEAGDMDIYVMNADGTERVNITNRDAKDMDPTWSPDGEWDRLSQSNAGQDRHSPCPTQRLRSVKPHLFPGPTVYSTYLVSGRYEDRLHVKSRGGAPPAARTHAGTIL